MDEKVLGAEIAAAMSLVVALLGIAANFFITRLQVRSKINELTQTQLKDVLAKRIEVYPELWRIAQAELSDSEREEKLVNPGWARGSKAWENDAKWELDAKWPENLLMKLMSWHQDYGVFLSQPTYVAFDRLRAETEDLAIRCNREKRGPTIAEFRHLDKTFYSASGDELPLATLLKKDLGSYNSPFISE